MVTNTRKPFKAGAIRMKDGTILNDAVIFMTDNFLIVAESPEDDHPSWINISEISRLENVQPLPEPEKPKRNRDSIYFF